MPVPATNRIGITNKLAGTNGINGTLSLQWIGVKCLAFISMPDPEPYTEIYKPYAHKMQDIVKLMSSDSDTTKFVV